MGIFAINEAVDSGDVGRTLSALRSPDVGLYGVIPECGETYLSDLAEAKKKRLAAGELWDSKHTRERVRRQEKRKGQVEGETSVYGLEAHFLRSRPKL